MSYIHDSFYSLRKYCEVEDFRGWDPYDGLNAPIVKYLPFKNSKFFRLSWIQSFKRSPINLHKIFSVPKGYNPKGLALFLSGYANLYLVNAEDAALKMVDYLASKLLELQSAGFSGACWGYNFDWQSRTFFIPANMPNVVVSSFCGQAFLDAYQVTKNEEYLRVAVSVTEFIRQDLNRSNEGDVFCFSYSPMDTSRVFNASLLAAAFLARVYSFNQDHNLKEYAKQAVGYVCRHQNVEGSWFYGMDTNQHWIDGFHTAYNLEAIHDYMRHTQDLEYQPNFDSGLDFYTGHFFTMEGKPKYYFDNVYPIDVHCAAELCVLMAKTGLFSKHESLVKGVLSWTIANMQSEKGYFYYQKTPRFTNKIPYMRWANAWMFYGLSRYLRAESGK